MHDVGWILIQRWARRSKTPYFNFGSSVYVYPRQATECIHTEGILNSTVSPHPFHATSFYTRKETQNSMRRPQYYPSIAEMPATNKKSWQDDCGLQNGSISSFALNRSITIEITQWVGNNRSMLYSKVGRKEKYTESRNNNKSVCYF